MSKKLNLVAQNRENNALNSLSLLFYRYSCENNASVLPRRFALEPLAAGHRALPNDH